MLYLAQEMVLPLKEAGKGNSRKFRVGALNEKWAWTERKWAKVTSDTGIGDPSAANPVKGEKFFNAVVNKLSELMYDLSVTGISDMYV
jgi:creatinine amidohydrolase